MKQIFSLFIALFCVSSILIANESSEPKANTKPSEGNLDGVIVGIPLYQYHVKKKNGNIYYYDTRSSVEKDKGKKDGIVCSVPFEPISDAVPLYQFHKGDFYAYSTDRTMDGYTFDGQVCYIFKTPGYHPTTSNLSPLYEYVYFDGSGNAYFYYDKRAVVEPDKGSRRRIVGYVW